MTAALYRRYRPETFGQMIGQAQVTDPLMTALRNDRVGHAYLFSGPRGCGKTTSARVLARCLNCAEGPTDTPCGVCPSCVELSRAGGGSLDVVEIDAASHNGVDDARDLRERAIFAPARDRFKIFILDEAHMVTQQGFNALLKLVEEPPDHVKFIFATTEPDKVLGTIRSRTHHYPFRLVPPGPMLEYVQELSAQEGVQVEPGVLPLVVRAGGGSPRDTLSLLDQLIAGSDISTESGSATVRYERAVSLLGYTHAELLDEVVEALADPDPAAAFGAVDRVVQTGQDPRRFVDDLLERLRDLIVVEATGPAASAVLRGVPVDELERMGRQARIFGGERLSRVADLVSRTLDDMTGATSPRLQLELMIARVLASEATPAAGASPAAGAPPVTSAPPVAAPAKAPAAEAPVRPAASTPGAITPAAPAPSVAPATAPAAAAQADPAPAADPAPTEPEPPVDEPARPRPTGPVTVAMLRDAWPEVLSTLEDISRTSWLVASNARVHAYEDDVLTVTFQSQSDVQKFRQRGVAANASEDLRTAIDRVLGVRVKFLARLDGPDPAPPADEPPPPDDGPPDDAPPHDQPPSGWVTRAPGSGAERPEGAPSAPVSTSRLAPAPVTEWAVAVIPRTADEPPVALGTIRPPAQLAVDDEPEEAVASPALGRPTVPEREGQVLSVDEPPVPDEPDVDVLGPGSMTTAPAPARTPAPAQRVTDRYGEAVVRQVLGATFVREERFEQPTRFS
ncbi:MAG: DNA polymerase III subunit gamma and tau [Microbacterium sp.]|uniref:DNA polymerase III subunit gamma and tau n=1 Tax=Microbacterium sp. TaxID=51671 RepID=UPI0027204D14|nr:DNA polymerase III subunit gamma and tau [Microbacterium sp.]MDO8381787.1 DNA polymerase III subunit gamma and tau [Microbacterium sp.]